MFWVEAILSKLDLPNCKLKVVAFDKNRNQMAAYSGNFAIKLGVTVKLKSEMAEKQLVSCLDRSVSLSLNVDSRFSLIDVHGKTVYCTSIHKKQRSFSIPEEVKAGFYLGELKGADGSVSVIKMSIK